MEAEDAHYQMPGGYGVTPAERLDALYQRPLEPPTLEVSTAGRVRYLGKLLKVERHGKHGRVWLKGKRHDVAQLMRRVVGLGPIRARELWFEVSSQANSPS